MEHLNRSPLSPLQSSIIKKAKSLENTCDRNEMTDNNTLSQTIKDTFSTPVFIEQLCNSLVNSDVFLKAIETIVASACKRQQEQISELTVELDKTKSELEKVSSHLNDLEQYGKRKDLLIHGIPVKNDENLYTTVMELGNALGIKLNRNNFYAIHRLPAKRTGDQLKSTIIVSFVRITDRNKFYLSHKQLRRHEKFKNIFVNEHLTSYNNQLYFYAKQKLDKKRVFTRNGNVYLFIEKGKYRRFKSMVDIDNAYDQS
ncbi:unnamed protein product, partial [Didymodactylos carnosus]